MLFTYCVAAIFIFIFWRFFFSKSCDLKGQPQTNSGCLDQRTGQEKATHKIPWTIYIYCHQLQGACLTPAPRRVLHGGCTDHSSLDNPVVQRGREVIWGERTKSLLGVAAAYRSSVGNEARLLPGWCATLVAILEVVRCWWIFRRKS
jgi:hypothetical protein